MYCPSCGKQLQADLQKLVEYCRMWQKKNQDGVKRRMQRAQDEQKKEYWIKEAGKRQKQADKWRSWADEVERLMKHG